MKHVNTLSDRVDRWVQCTHYRDRDNNNFFSLRLCNIPISRLSYGGDLT